MSLIFITKKFIECIDLKISRMIKKSQLEIFPNTWSKVDLPSQLISTILHVYIDMVMKILSVAK